MKAQGGIKVHAMLIDGGISAARAVLTVEQTQPSAVAIIGARQDSRPFADAGRSATQLTAACFRDLRVVA
jgi:hypothetical protein